MQRRNIMSSASGIRIAVGGATGNVGSEMLRVLEQRGFPAGAVIPLASAASAGRTVRFRGRELPVGDLAAFDFTATDLLLLSTGAANSRETSPRAAAAGCVVIDNSSAFRMDPAVPLVVPEVNPQDLAGWHERRILAVANCSTIALAVALKPLHDAARIRRVVVATYQSASGGGRHMLGRLLSPLDAVGADVHSLLARAKAVIAEGGEKPLPFNVIPHIDVFLDDGRTREEWKMEAETRKILGEPDLPVSATCARVPVLVGHSAAVNVEFGRPLSVEDARALLRGAPGITVIDERHDGGYATPLDAAGTDPVYVSRLRKDRTVPHGLGFWVVADNVRKGAALNAVQIAEALASIGAFSSAARAA
jgi:aspartate-semialdehyde dehydrogenase